METYTTSIAPPTGDGQGATYPPTTTGPTFFPSTTIGPAASPGLVPPAGVSSPAAPAGGEDTQDDDAPPLTRAALRQLATACRGVLRRLDALLALPPARYQHAGAPTRRRPAFFRPSAGTAGEPPDGAALRRWRDTLGVSQRELAKAAGYSRGLLSDVESGRRDSWDARAGIAAALAALGRAQEQGEPRPCQ